MLDDPLAANILPDPDARARLLHLGTLERYCALFGRAQGIGDPLQAATIWLAPGQAEMTPEGIEAAGIDQLRELIGAAPAHGFLVGQTIWKLCMRER